MAALKKNDVESADKLREQGNQLFKQQSFGEAARCYNEALSLLRGSKDTDVDAEAASLSQAVRLNLATCFFRLDERLDEGVILCDEVVALESSHTKAIFRRGTLRLRLAQLKPPDGQRELLQAARKDLLQAARAEPADRQIRDTLEKVSEALRQLQLRGGGFLGGGGLYDDVEATPPPPPPVVCSTCNRVGHPCCGKAWWVSQRSEWLGIEEAELWREPEDFEDMGTLAEAVLETRANAERVSPVNGEVLSDLSDSERDDLESCLEATERPFPQLKRKLPLSFAVRCAEELWSES